MALIAYAIARPALDSAASMVQFFGVVYVLERGAVELWKTFLRNEDQSKYFIPMQFAVFGNVVQSQSRRYLIGAIMTTAVCGTFLLVHYGAPHLQLQNNTWLVFAIATISGWISAFLGAWKDAPIEGFQPLKFVRSPLWAGFWGLLLAHFTGSILVVMMAGSATRSSRSRPTRRSFSRPSRGASLRASRFRSPTCSAAVSISCRSMR
jgi:hypothetical protein